MARELEKPEFVARTVLSLRELVGDARRGVPAPTPFDPFRRQEDGRVLLPDGTSLEQETKE